MEIGDNLKRARLLKNLSLKEAGKILNMSAPAISKYEKGEIIPNSKKIIEFANAYNVKTIDLLKSYDLPQMKFNSFRKKKKLSGQKLELAKEIIQTEVAKYFEVLDLNEFSDLYLPLPKYKCYDINDAEICAEKFRKEVIEISDKLPISDLTSILENLGIVIVIINKKIENFDGLSEIVNDRPVIVLASNNDDGARQRFTIAHELGHLVLDIPENMDSEKLCNRFASALLMPKKATINEFGESRNKISFYELDAFKKEYKVSYTAIIFRLKNLNIISEYQYRNLSIYLNKYIGRNDPDPILLEKTYQFEKIVHKLETNNIITITKARELLGVSNDEYRQKNNNYGY